MKKGTLIAFLLFFIGLSMVGLLILVPNPLGRAIVQTAKAKGYLPYTPAEAITLAYNRCTTCHEEEKIIKYCARCGPPFIVVIHFMRKNVEIANSQGKNVKPFSDAELITITQVWNALVGNWESDWPRKDIKKLLGGDRALIRLFETPVAERPIEVALREKNAPGSYKEVIQRNNEQGL
ncbi:MAG: hypothetical protein ACC669_08530 [bacterium]